MVITSIKAGDTGIEPVAFGLESKMLPLHQSPKYVPGCGDGFSPSSIGPARPHALSAYALCFRNSLQTIPHRPQEKLEGHLFNLFTVQVFRFVTRAGAVSSRFLVPSKPTPGIEPGLPLYESGTPPFVFCWQLRIGIRGPLIWHKKPASLLPVLFSPQGAFSESRYRESNPGLVRTKDV
jgi:hypothetical protein